MCVCVWIEKEKKRHGIRVQSLSAEREGGRGHCAELPQALTLQAAVVMVTHLHTYYISAHTYIYAASTHGQTDRQTHTHTAHTHTAYQAERGSKGVWSKDKAR